jgi:hypothetical protein
MSEDTELRANVGGKVVTVQTLRVDGKKMTLQFFRQIPVADWLGEDQKPRPDMNIWGRVSYRIPDEGTEWLVVEVGGNLMRCNIDPPSANLDGWLSDTKHSIEKAMHAAGQAQAEAACSQRQADVALFPQLRAAYEVDRDRYTATAERETAKAQRIKADGLKVFLAQERAELRALHLERLGEIPQLFIG